jgi:hypothetical protein
VVALSSLSLKTSVAVEKLNSEKMLVDHGYKKMRGFKVARKLGEYSRQKSVASPYPPQIGPIKYQHG